MSIIMKLISSFWLQISLCLLLMTGCSKSDDQRKFEERALTSPDGITETNGNGDIIDGKIDNDDWQVGPMYAQRIQINAELTHPPFPNPLSYNQTLNLEIFFNVSDPVDAISVQKFSIVGERNYPEIAFRNGDELINSFNTIPIQGKEIAKGAGSGGKGLYRILIYDRRGNLISYGDVQIK